MDNLSGCKVVHIDSRRRIALQVVDLLLPGAPPARRTRIANRILVMCCEHKHSRNFSESPDS
jgi:hypothetical protein